jgi:hypothetical protein
MSKDSKSDKHPVTRRLVACTQSTGRVGKSTVAEGLITWLRFAEIPYAAVDSDRQHRTLANRYPTVDTFDATKSINDFHSMIRALPDFPVTIVDFPAQSTDFLLGAFQHFRLLESFEASGVRPTLLIFAADDSTAAESASASARFFLDKADYLLIENPAKFQSSEFKKTALFKWLSERKTPTIRLPAVTEVTINEWKALERRSKKYIQLEEAVKHPDLFYTVRDELTYFRDAFLAQFEDYAVPRIISDAGFIKNKVVRGEALQTVAAAAALEDPWL